MVPSRTGARPASRSRRADGSLPACSGCCYGNRAGRTTPVGLVLVHQAALLHHVPPLLLDPVAMGRLLADVMGVEQAFAESTPLIPSEVAAILRILHSRFHRPASDQIVRVAAILQLSDLIDEQIQLQAYDDCLQPGIWAGLEQISEFTLFDRTLLQDARRALNDGSMDVVQIDAEVAVEARTARRVFTRIGVSARL